MLERTESQCKVMTMNREEGLKCKFHVDRIRLEHVLEFKYFGCVLEESGSDGAECSRRVAGAIKSLVNTKDLQLEYARVCMKHCLYLFSYVAVRQCY